MSEPRDAFGGHRPTIETIREHRKWHDDTDHVSAVCWKEAEYLRWLLREVDALMPLASLGAAHSVSYPLVAVPAPGGATTSTNRTQGEQK